MENTNAQAHACCQLLLNTLLQKGMEGSSFTFCTVTCSFHCFQHDAWCLLSVAVIKHCAHGNQHDIVQLVAVSYTAWVAV